MATAAVPGRLIWRFAEVRETIDETPTVRTLRLDVPGWPGHVAGQHVDIRLTAPDGYRAQRSYSIATAPDGERLDVAVERLVDGEVSPYLNGILKAGDRIELRGPIGGHFIWEPSRGGPVLLVAGGSGVVPLMAMARARAQAASSVPMRLLTSSRGVDDIIYRTDLAEMAAAGDGFEVFHTLTRVVPDGWHGFRRRVDAEMLAEVGWPRDGTAQIFVCGPTPFVEVVARLLVELGYGRSAIKTERFGATGHRT